MYPRYCPQPMREDSLLSGPLEPSNESYALAKLAGWKLVESYNLQYGTKFRTVIPANLYGPNDNFDPYEGHVIPALIQKIHNAKEEKSGEITVWGSGEARRDFLFVDDLVEAFDFLEQHPKVLGPINIGTPREVSIRQLVDLLREVIDFSGAIHFDHSKPDGMPFKKVDTHQLDKLGWRSGTSLRDGLEKTYEWFLYSKQNSRA
jgi:GDP-L-fucose synthase